MALHFARRGRLPLALLPGVLPIPLGKAGRRATIAAGGASPAGCSNGEARGSGATATPGPMEPHPSPPSLRGSPPRRPQETRACAFRGRLIRWLVTSKRTLRGSYGKERWGAEKAVPYACFARFSPRVAELLHDLHYRECQEETLGVVAHCGRPPLAGHCAGGLFASHHTDIQKVFARSATVLAKCAGRARR